MSTEFQEYLKSKGIQHELTVAYTPQQNGIAERMNQTLMESARSIMAHGHLPNYFWAEAVATASYLRNCSATTVHEDGKTPYEKWYGRKPNLGHLCCICIHSSLHKAEVAEKLRFVGYSKNPKGYRLYDECTNKVVTRRDVIFDETNFLVNPETKRSTENLEVLFPDESPETITEETGIQEAVSQPQFHRSGRAHNPPERFGNWVSCTANCEHLHTSP